ncbi:KLHL4 [Symbiodinium natans]|uniref:KLHL4 protein n=1 Tax=Symbiodinium natans TaxID=878477 RepID=A0A812V4M5_9DINO|nr:KLHL4 [Symbiodinium natans]
MQSAQHAGRVGACFLDVLSCEPPAAEVVFATGLAGCSRAGQVCRQSCRSLQPLLSRLYPHRLCLLGGEILESPSPFRASARVLGRVHSLDASSEVAASKGSVAWLQELPMPSCRSFMAVLACGVKVYVLGGQRPTKAPGFKLRHLGFHALASFDCFDADARAWESLQPMPTARRSLAAAFVDGFIYAAGGSNCADRLDVVERYSHKRGWETMPPLPTAREGLALVSIPSQIFAIGGLGSSGSPLKDVEVFELPSHSWTKLNCMPFAFGNCSAVSFGGNIYVFGGYSGVGSEEAWRQNALQQFDPHAQCWHALGGASLPHPRWGSAVALDAEGRLFVCGGYKELRASRHVEVLDLRRPHKGWRPGPLLPGACAGCSATSVRLPGFLRPGFLR